MHGYLKCLRVNFSDMHCHVFNLSLLQCEFCILSCYLQNTYGNINNNNTLHICIQTISTIATLFHPYFHPPITHCNPKHFKYKQHPTKEGEEYPEITNKSYYFRYTSRVELRMKVVCRQCMGYIKGFASCSSSVRPLIVALISPFG